jgi:predicted nucleic acid-binding protein
VSSFVLDTNIVIGLLDGRESARHILDRHGARPSTSGVSQITRLELLGFAGLSAIDEGRILAFLTAVTVLPLDAIVEARVIALRRSTWLTLADAIVVATAVVNGRILLTLDDTVEKAFAIAARR